MRSEIKSTLAQAQSGFWKDKSIQYHIFTIKKMINGTLSRTKTLYLVFMDMEKAEIENMGKYKYERCK